MFPTMTVVSWHKQHCDMWSVIRQQSRYLHVTEEENMSPKRPKDKKDRIHNVLHLFITGDTSVDMCNHLKSHEMAKGPTARKQKRFQCTGNSQERKYHHTSSSLQHNTSSNDSFYFTEFYCKAHPHRLSPTKTCCLHILLIKSQRKYICNSTEGAA